MERNAIETWVRSTSDDPQSHPRISRTLHRPAYRASERQMASLAFTATSMHRAYKRLINKLLSNSV